MEPRPATPKTPPSSRIALLEPEALPSSSRRTLERTTFATGAKKSAIPIPEITKAGTRLAEATVGVVIAASAPEAPRGGVGGGARGAPIRLRRAPGCHRRPPADPVGEGARQRGDEDRH